MMWSGKFLISSSQCSLGVAASLWFLSLDLSIIIYYYNHQIGFFSLLLYQYITDLQSIIISKYPMEDNPKASTSTLEKKQKDYLYRIAKMRENTMICDKGDVQREYANQNEHTLTQDNQNQDDVDCQFELNLPQHRPQATSKISSQNQQRIKLNIVNSKQVLSKNQYPGNSSQPKDQQNVPPLKQSTQSNRQVDDPMKNEKQRKVNSKITSPKPVSFLKFDEDESNEPEQQQVSDIGSAFKAPVLEAPPALPREIISSIVGSNNRARLNFQTVSQQKPQEQLELQEKYEQKAIEEDDEQMEDQQQKVEEEDDDEDIKGVTIMSNSMDGNIMIKITNKEQLVLSRLPPGIILKCIIRRSTDIFNPQFDFYLNNGLKHMISAKKYSLAKKEIFKLSLELGKYRERDIIGCIMANTAHNVYWMYRRVLESEEDSKKEIKCVVRYEKIVKDVYREMNVQLFVDDKKQVMVEHSKMGHEIAEEHDLSLKNIPLQPKQSSSKNYTLFDNEDKQYKYLKMVKVSDHMFEVEIQHPLSPLQAFAISLTRFDAELK